MSLQEPSLPNFPPLEGCTQDGVAKRQLTINGIILNQRPVFNLPFNANLNSRAKELRYARNLPEVLFWMRVTKSQFHQIDFDRQRIIGNYIVDFCIKQLGLVIEIDGDSHDLKADYDEVREKYLKSLGLKIYRISVDDVLRNMEFALMGLENFIIESYGSSTPRPSDTPLPEGNSGDNNPQRAGW